jgi:hypothetical protein
VYNISLYVLVDFTPTQFIWVSYRFFFSILAKKLFPVIYAMLIQGCIAITCLVYWSSLSIWEIVHGQYHYVLYVLILSVFISHYIIRIITSDHHLNTIVFLNKTSICSWLIQPSYPNVISPFSDILGEKPVAAVGGSVGANPLASGGGRQIRGGCWHRQIRGGCRHRRQGGNEGDGRRGLTRESEDNIGGWECDVSGSCCHSLFFP